MDLCIKQILHIMEIKIIGMDSEEEKRVKIVVNMSDPTAAGRILFISLCGSFDPIQKKVTDIKLPEGFDFLACLGREITVEAPPECIDCNFFLEMSGEVVITVQKY